MPPPVPGSTPVPPPPPERRPRTRRDGRIVFFVAAVWAAGVLGALFAGQVDDSFD